MPPPERKMELLELTIRRLTAADYVYIGGAQRPSWIDQPEPIPHQTTTQYLRRYWLGCGATGGVNQYA